MAAQETDTCSKSLAGLRSIIPMQNRKLKQKTNNDNNNTNNQRRFEIYQTVFVIMAVWEMEEEPLVCET